MSLPVIEFPKFRMTLPVSKTHIEYRPILQKDEKILLIAKESQDPTDILAAIKQVVASCIISKVDKDIIDVDILPIADLEWAFIQLRSTSVSNISKVSYKDGEDEEVRDFEIKLNEVKVIIKDDPNSPDTPSPKIVINDKVVVNLRYPPASLYSDKEFLDASGEDALTKLGASCIKNVQVNGIIEPSTDKVEEWILTWPVPVYQKLTDWISNLPHLEYTIKYTNNMGHERTIVLRTLNDFFTFA